MAEKPEIVNQFEESIKEELKTEDTTMDEEPFEQIEIENAGVDGKDEVDGKKLKKSGLLGRLSTRKKKSRKNSKGETQIIEGRGKTDQSAELDVNNVDETESETSVTPEDKEKSVEADENGGQKKDEKAGDCAKAEDSKPREVEVSETEGGKRKKPGRLRRLSFSKIKKSKKQVKTETKPEGKEDLETDNKDDDEQPIKLEEKNDDETVDCVDVQNVHTKCEEPERPETVVQSEDDTTTDQPITDVDLESDEELAVEKVDKDLGINENYNEDNLLEAEAIREEPENDSKTSYVTLVISLPSDIAQKAVQTFRQVLKPVFTYLVKKHPNCFKDMMERNKKTSRRPSQL